MDALPSALALVAAILLAAPLLAAMRSAGLARANYRGRALPFPFGLLIPLAALLALVPVMLVQRLASTALLGPAALPVYLYCLAVITLGLIDDRFAASAAATGAPAPRGLRGHVAAVRRGELSTGALKAAGSLGAALLAIAYLRLGVGRWLLAAAVLVLATHLFNLLDLRPGRAAKALVLLGAGLALGSQDVRPIWTVGLFAAPALVAGGYDLRERALLGDTGASLLGAVAGLLLVLSLSRTGQLVALALLVIATAYGELRSISALVERTPGLRELDSWGRPS
jgi:UDP-N-acetylmuramyl pentapeptide phosphotransferase/UDP-N-acetylglucosamine-1-phosphate transferase